MGMVWDYAMLCYKAIHAFNQYVINDFGCMSFSPLGEWQPQYRLI